mmetsp:Transcript_45141/g.114470  ORF Transcript_45141/g.114470 Transcript_45141/m.114470 type:complete len:245 (-) Transcript_45141:11-745(-)
MSAHSEHMSVSLAECQASGDQECQHQRRRPVVPHVAVHEDGPHWLLFKEAAAAVGCVAVGGSAVGAGATSRRRRGRRTNGVVERLQVHPELGRDVQLIVGPQPVRHEQGLPCRPSPQGVARSSGTVSAATAASDAALGVVAGGWRAARSPMRSERACGLRVRHADDVAHGKASEGAQLDGGQGVAGITEQQDGASIFTVPDRRGPLGLRLQPEPDAHHPLVLRRRSRGPGEPRRVGKGPGATHR